MSIKKESYSYSKTEEYVEESYISKSGNAVTESKIVQYSESFDTDDSKSEPVFDLYVAIADYTPDNNDTEAVPLAEGQIVEVLDSNSSQRWLVRTRPTKTAPGKQGWVPPSYLEKKTLSSTLKSIQDILEMEVESKMDVKEKEADRKRTQVVKELVETEEEFSKDMQQVVSTYLKDFDTAKTPKELRDLRDSIFMNFKQICDFHTNVLIKGVQYYAAEPLKLGKTFLRLERDFDMHVRYCRDEPQAQEVLAISPAKEFFEEYSKRIGEVDKSLRDHLKLPIQRINDYQLLLKELIKYSARLKEDCTDLQKALDLMLSIPQRAHDLKFINSIQGYRGNLFSLGRVLRHDWFTVTDSEGKSKERYLFLFKSRVLITKVRKISEEKSVFILKDIIRLPDVEVRESPTDKCKIELHHKQKGFPRYPLSLIAKTEFIREAWVKELKDHLAELAGIIDLGIDEIEVEPEKSKAETADESETYEELNTVMTESLRSGSMTSTEAKKDKKPSPPRFTKPLRPPKALKPGDNLTLECEVTAIPPATVSWLKNNIPLSESDRFKFVSKGNVHCLTVKGVQIHDEGLYTAKASNASGSAANSAVVCLEVPKEDERPATPGGTPIPHKPTFPISLKDTELLEGTSVTFMIKVRAHPEAQVKFFKDGKDLKQDDRIKIVAEDKETFELIITNVTKADAGKYSCKATNSQGESSCEAELKVTDEKKLFEGQFEEAKKKGIIKPGEEPEFKWFRDGQEFEASERFKVMFKDEEDTVALVFQHVKPEDAGLYTCVASTTSGKISCSAELTVQGAVNQLAKEPEAPKFVTELQDTEVSAGGSAMLELKVSGYPKPNITWQKDGQEVKAGGRLRFLHEDEESIALVIKQVTKEDSGKYKVTAKNELGQVITTANLVVKAPPAFKKQLTDISAMMSEDIRIEVEIEGNPAPEVIWYKDGQQVVQSDRIKMVHEKGEIFALVIKKAAGEDAGSYNCVATNSGGKTSEFSNVTVNVPAGFAKELKTTEIKETETVKLEAKVVGSPIPKAKWLKDGQELKADGKHIKIEQDERNHSVTIDKAVRKDAGKFTIEVTNEFGTKSSSGDLIINCIPEFSAKLGDVTIKEGDQDVKFEVKLSGTPTPKIKWFIESMEITEKSNNFKVINDGEAQALIIKNVEESCSGKITCQATNPMGDVKTSAVINVLTKPKFTQSVTDKEVTEGDTVKYTVTVHSNPPSEVKWYKNNQEVTVDAKVKITKESSETWSLTLDCVSAATAGDYECRAKNSEGESITKSKLIVNTKPTFDKGIQDQDIWLGLEAILEVKVQGIPYPEVKWIKDDKPLAFSDRVKSDKKDNVHILHMKETKVEDGGHYRCEIKNKIGEEVTKAKLTIKTPADANEPAITKPLSNVMSVRYSPAVFEARILGNPKPMVNWFKDGKPLQLDERIVASEVKDDFLYRLTINKSVVEDMGKYKITAENESDTISTEAELDVKVPPEITISMDRKIMPKGQATFEAKVTGLPQPKVSWWRKGKELVSGPIFKWTADDKKQIYVLNVDGADVEDGGEYQCVGENMVGKATQPFNLLITTDLPKFTKVMEDILVKPTKPCQFDVEVDGIPMPHVKWFFKGTEIKESDKFKFVQHDERNHSLVITPMLESDVGEYTCKAISKAGENSCSAKIGVKHDMPFYPKHVPKEVCAIDGEDFTVEAIVDGSPQPTIKWLKDGKEVVPSDRITMEYFPDTGVARLTVKGAKIEDIGKYTLIATNATGELSSTGVVKVEVVPKPPSFIEKLKKTDIVQGAPMQLCARVTGHPKPSVKWFKDGKPIRPTDPNFRTAEKPDGCIALIIDETKPEDAGKYGLQVRNSLGESLSEAEVTVKSAPEAPEFLLKPKHTDVFEGFSIKLDGRVKGFPAPTLKWLKDGKEFTPDGERVITSYKPEDGTFSLIINKCKTDDTAKYSCVATNSLGENTAVVDLGVRGRTKGGEALCAPSFVTSLSDINIDEGGPIRMTATIAGNPVPEIKWTKDGEPISSTDTMNINFDGQRVILEIKKGYPKDVGKYECTLSNVEGSTSSISNVKVKKLSKAPVFTQRFPDVNAVLGQDVQFVCRAVGLPNPEAIWYFNDKQLQDSDKYRTKHEADMFALFIKNCQLADIGNIICKIKNSDGEDKCVAFLNVTDTKDVKPLTEPPSFLKKLADCDVIEGMLAKFTACISGLPEPEFKWYKDGRELVPTNRIKFEVEPHGLLRLLIKPVGKDDIGKYSLKITNSLGSDESSASLNCERGEEKKPKKPMADERIEYEKVKRSGVPYPLPDKPIISKMTDRRLTLSWKPSLPLGPQPPVTYTVEMCKSDPDDDWFTVRRNIKGCCIDIRNLEPFQDYKFRVRVENKYGISDPSPQAIAYRTKLEMPIPKFLPSMPAELDFRPETSQYFPKDFDLDKPPHEAYAHPPHFLRQDIDTQYGVKNQPSSMHWYIYGYPMPTVSWVFNNEKLEMHGKYDSSFTRNGQASLYINRFTDRDVGIYECIAVNEHGEARQRVRMEIAEPPEFTMQLEESTILLRDSGTLQCRVTGIPKPEIKWYKDWHPLADSNRIKMDWKEPDLCTLTISDTITKDAGLYSCTARNLAGMASNSVMVTIEDNESNYAILTYSHNRVIKARHTLFEDSYDLGDELGRGTQSRVYHAVERATGNSYAGKVMTGKGDLHNYMNQELDIMNQLHDRQLIRAVDAFTTKIGMTLITELASGGDLLDNIIKQDTISESEVALYIRQILWGLDHMHGKGIAHLGLTIGDLLVAKPGGDEIKICDFGLARRLVRGNDYFVDYGMPEFVAPEIANKRPVSFSTDMWSVGVITYLLLSGISPFLGDHDRHTLQQVQQGKVNFDAASFTNISDEAKDFISKLLVFDSSCRLDVKSALKHPWLKWADRLGTGERISTDRLRNYYKKYREWTNNSACRRWYRRRPLASCFTHPSRMVYPPDEEYTPPPSRETSPSRKLGPIPSFKDRIDNERERMEYDLGYVDSESRYQMGPDTYLLQLRDVGLPLRLREYMRVSASACPTMGLRLQDTLLGRSVTIRERRRFHDIMDEEIDDERSGHDNSSQRRITHEVAPRSETKSRIKELLPMKNTEGKPPFFREKLHDKAFAEEKPVELSCVVIGDPKPVVQWYRNDVILAETHRLQFVESDGRSILKFSPAKAFDAGVYKAIARNLTGEAICRAGLRLGDVPGRPDAPEVSLMSDSEALIKYQKPRDKGNSAIACYEVEYKEPEATEWIKVNNNITHDFYLIRNLKPRTLYHFRFRAMNEFGWGDFSVPSEAKKTGDEGCEKISISKAMKHQQELTEGGFQVDTLSRRPSLDYSMEDTPVSLKEGVSPTDSYNFISEIARGQFSVLVKCSQKDNEKTLSAKLVDASGENEAKAKREYDILKSLAHERIASLKDAFRHNNLYALVMEKLQGYDILTYLTHRHEYSEEMVTKIISQTLDALQYLHFRGIVHLDIQPDNIVMKCLQRVEVKLVDFGSAVRLPPSCTTVIDTQPNLLEYRAPEVIAKEDISAQADVWSLGVLVYVLLGGVSPFLGNDEKDTKENIALVRYRFEHLYKEITMESTRFLMQLFKRTPTKRPTVDECLEHKWLNPSELMLRKRERAVFLSNRLKQYADDYHRKRQEVATKSETLLSAFGTQFSRSVSVECDAQTTF